MSGERQRWPRAFALDVVRELLAELSPACERICVAGSLRRKKAEVGDVELLFIPKLETRRVDLLTDRECSLAEEVIERWLAQGMLHKRASSVGTFTWGPLNKLAVHYTGMPVDLFTEPRAEDWWRSLVIRTGPKEMNVRLINSAAERGIHVHAYGAGITSATQGELSCANEAHFFELCGCPYLAPEERR